MKYCENCKKEYDDVLSYCPNCGKIIKKEQEAKKPMFKTNQAILSSLLFSIYIAFVIILFKKNGLNTSFSSIFTPIITIIYLCGAGIIPFSIISLVSAIKSKNTGGLIWTSMILGSFILISLFLLIQSSKAL